MNTPAIRCLFRQKLINYWFLRSSYSFLYGQVRHFAIIAKTNDVVIRSPFSGVTQIRNKYNKSSQEEDSDDEKEDEDDLDKKSIVKLTVQSLRTDLIIKSALNIARNKIDTAFYENRIMVNGKKLLKKSSSVGVGDEIDFIKNESPTNPNHLIAARIEILSVAANAKEDSLTVKVKRFKSLTIEKE